MNTKLYELIKANETEKSFTYPKVNEIDIAKAEEELGVTIPQSYRSFLIEFGMGGLDGMDILGFGINKQAIFVEFTKDRRTYGMPQNVIAIENCDEWVYCIHSETGAVMEWYRDSEKLYPAYDNFDEFLLNRINDSLENMEKLGQSNKISVKIFPIQNETKILFYIHKKTGISLGDIKERISKKEYILSCDYHDTEAMRNMKSMLEEIKNMGASVAIYEKGQKISEQYFSNWINTCEDVRREQKELKELILEDKEEANVTENNSTGRLVKQYMRTNWIYFPLAIVLVCVCLSFIVNDTGTLLGDVLNGCMIVFLGLFWMILGISWRRNNGKRDRKFTITGVLLGCVFLIFGGSYLLKAGMDTMKGPVTVTMSDCTVYKNASRRRILHSYYIKGTTSSGENERFKIDRSTYYQYYGQHDFTVVLIYWEYSNVVKEIIYYEEGVNLGW